MCSTPHTKIRKSQWYHYESKPLRFICLQNQSVWTLLKSVTNASWTQAPLKGCIDPLGTLSAVISPGSSEWVGTLGFFSKDYSIGSLWNKCVLIPVSLGWRGKVALDTSLLCYKALGFILRVPTTVSSLESFGKTITHAPSLVKSHTPRFFHSATFYLQFSL